MARLVIHNVTELKNLQSKLKILKAAFPFIQKNAINSVSKDNILEQMKSKMKLNDFSEKIIKATFVGPVNITSGKVQIHFISDYESDDGFDVSEAREEGTKDHDVFPKKPGGWLRWFDSAGQPVFRRKSHPSGIKRLLIIEKTINENQPRAAIMVGEKIAESASKILGV